MSPSRLNEEICSWIKCGMWDWKRKEIKLIVLVICVLSAMLNVKGQSSEKGRALYLCGGQYVNLSTFGDAVALPVSISVWIKPYTEYSNHCIFYSHCDTASYSGFWFQIRDGKLVIAYGDGTAKAEFARRSGVADVHLYSNRWYHLAGVIRSATDMELYLSGRSREVTYTCSGGPSIATPARLRRNERNSNWPVQYLNADVGKLAIWNTDLSQNQIRRLMCRHLTGEEDGLLAYYSFDDGSVNTLSDKTQGWHQGHLRNKPIWMKSSVPMGTDPFALLPKWS